LLQRSIHKKIVVKQEFKANPSLVIGDPNQLQNALLNLALNARDAMPKKGGEITFITDIADLDNEFCVQSSYEITTGKYLRVLVTDTGTGMDEDTLRHIFEPFFTTKELGKGTGMGLAAVYGTIKNHKGAINVYSELKKGTTFELYLPAYISDIKAEGEELKKQEIIEGKAHILLVDDEEMICEMATNMLQRYGYKVTTCMNGKEAIKTYKKFHKDFDLVILDLIMPELDGKDAFFAMQKINPGIIALLSSGYSMDGEAEALLEKGVAGFIQKPFRIASLSEKISEALG
jgi:CheY-like chemotaxis protein